MKDNLVAMILTLTLALVGSALADGPADNIAEQVRPVPPPGINVSREDNSRLAAGLDRLDAQLANLRSQHRDKPEIRVQLPDIAIYVKAVRYALKYNEFFDAREIAVADGLLTHASAAATRLSQGESLYGDPPRHTRTQRVHGYESIIDGSIQPYRIVIPPDYSEGSERPRRLDFWCHGRGETLSELNFISQTSFGEFLPPDAFVVHLYGRYCNANKLAGEIDLLEVLADVKRRYPIDENRIVIRGFSMGGAACWQFAVHYPGLFAAAAPGAGFSETPEFLKVFQQETLEPTWYERKLWHLYDCPDYAVNLFNCPTVAYSGDKDIQKQAADIMARALRRENIELTHVIGPDTAHSYHVDSKVEINRRIDAVVARGREPVPARVRFTTYTLRYPECLWVRLTGLESHWTAARVNAEIVTPNMVRVTTRNVTALRLQMPSGHCPLDATILPTVQIDGSDLVAPPVQSDRSWTVDFHRQADGWHIGPIDSRGLRKVPGLQGPIDDAFLDSFLMVRPTASPRNAGVGTWVESELKHAVEHWRKQFRGDVRIQDDTAVTDADIANHHLILWGDPTSNQLMAKIMDQLPVDWQPQSVKLGQESISSPSVVPVLIYPNPLNPRRYVVLNSGFTFRDYDYLNNARQIPKLPDWAFIDTAHPATSRAPGKIVAAGFFDEHWQPMK